MLNNSLIQYVCGQEAAEVFEPGTVTTEQLDGVEVAQIAEQMVEAPEQATEDPEQVEEAPEQEPQVTEALEQEDTEDQGPCE